MAATEALLKMKRNKNISKVIFAQTLNFRFGLLRLERLGVLNGLDLDVIQNHLPAEEGNLSL